jgi:hypothetical protein
MIGAAAFQVSGVVKDEAGRPVANAMVRLIVDEPTGPTVVTMGRWNQSRTDASGKFSIHNVTNGKYILLAIAPVVVSRATDRGAGAGTSGGIGSFVLSGGISGIGVGVTTETANGTTIQYREDAATRAPIAINDAHVGDLEIVVRRGR